VKELFRVVVAGVDVPIYRATAKEIPELKNDDGEDLHGCFIPAKAMICITQGQPKTVERDTINHELIHAWIYLSGAQSVLRMLLKKPDDLVDAEETLVAVLTPHIAGIEWCK